MLSIAQFFLLRGSEERRHEPFDLLGALLLLIGYPSLLIALSLGPGSGWDAPLTLLWFAIGGIGLASFAVRELHYEQPIFHFRFFNSGAFCVAMFMLVVASAVQNPITLFAPLYLQKVLNHNSLTVGFIMMALPISTLIAGPIGGSLSDRRPAHGRGRRRGGDLCGRVPLLARRRRWPAAAGGRRAGAGRHRRRAVPSREPGLGLRRHGPRDYGAVTAMLVLMQSLAGTLGTTIAVAMNETRSAEDTAEAFTDGQQFAFMLLIPLLVASVVVSFMGKVRRQSTPTPRWRFGTSS